MSLLRSVVDAWFVCAPSFGYVAQIREMGRTRSTDGYSLEGSLILLTCNGLRVIYFFGEPFAIALLLQSIVIIAVQLVLVVNVQQINASNQNRLLPEAPAWVPSGGNLSKTPSIVATGALHELATNTPLESNSLAIAHWAPRVFLVRYFLVLTVALLLSLFTFHIVPASISIMGYAALGVEATLIVPQLRLGYQRKSCEGLSLTLAGTWILGDVLKTVYFIVLRQPLPFLICAAVQLSLDAVLVYQFVTYGAGMATPAASTSSMPALDSGTQEAGAPDEVNVSRVPQCSADTESSSPATRCGTPGMMRATTTYATTVAAPPVGDALRRSTEPAGATSIDGLNHRHELLGAGLKKERRRDTAPTPHPC